MVSAFNEYQQRMPTDYRLKLIEINAQKRTKNSNLDKIAEQEEALIKKAIPTHTKLIALDRQGQSFDTQHLAIKLQNWHDLSQDICIIIGGPEGLSKDFLKTMHESWSLSKLTLPHPLVRVIIAEQMFRAWSILSGHPYHR